MAESFANILAVHLIRHITGHRRHKASADGILPRHKLRRVIEYIMENLEGTPTPEEMARVVDLSLTTSRDSLKQPPGWRHTSS